MRKLDYSEFPSYFWERVEVRGDDECWPWLRGTNPGGYGRVWYKGDRIQAHRIAYMLTHGPIPDGKHVLHSCDNPPCCNPEHLWVGTQEDNAKDRNSKGRAELTAYERGERARGAKLTDQEVAELRATYQQGGISLRELGARYGISKGHAWEITSGRQR